MKKILFVFFVLISCKFCHAVSSFTVVDDNIVFLYDDWNVKFPTATFTNPYPQPLTQELFIATMCYQSGNYSTALTIFTQSGLKSIVLKLASQLQTLQIAQIQTGIDYSTDISLILYKLNRIRNIYPSLQKN